MKNRFVKFVVMLLTVVLVGSGMTMLNLHIQKQSEGENTLYTPYVFSDKRDNVEIESCEDSMTTEEETYAELQLAEYSENTGIIEDGVITSEMASGSEDAFLVDLAAEMEVEEKSTGEVVRETSFDDKQIYYARLQDMEQVYVDRMNASSRESLTEQQKTVEQLLEIWDDELNAIYQRLRISMTKDEFYLLRNEERAWIRDRDAAANKAAASEKYSKIAQNLAYTRSLLQWTRQRVYELAAMYYEE